MPEIDEAEKQKLVDDCQIDTVLADILLARGLKTPQEVQLFLHPSWEHLHDPFLLKDMTLAVERIQKAIGDGEKIRIYGDYDADGVCSTTLMFQALRSLKADVDYYIPDRFREGYGLHRHALQTAKEEGVQLVITVDTGITAVDEAAYAREIGLDLIITDHHEPLATLPEAIAVINPKQPQCSYPFPQLAGVGVAFKLVQALYEQTPKQWLDLVALGTIADLVPLVGENRLFAAFGLEQMNRRQQFGLAALAEVAGIEGEIRARDVGFLLGPRINASGRLQSASKAVSLFLAEEMETARQIASELNQINQERQHLVREISEEAIAEVEADPELHRHVIVVASEGWHEGVIGIVASRLVERFYRPAIVLNVDPDKGIAKGSARSIEGFHMVEALRTAAGHLERFGGHTMAAGMTLASEKIPALRQALSAYAKETLSEEDYRPISTIDAVLSLREVTPELAVQLEQLAPFGVDNPPPQLLLRGSEIGRIQVVGAYKDTLKLQLVQGNSTLTAIGFQQGTLAEEITTGAHVQVVGELQVNEWNGRRQLQVLLHDLHIPQIQVFDWRSNRLATAQQEWLQQQGCWAVGHEQSLRWKQWGEQKIRWEEVQTSLSLLAEQKSLAFLDPPPSLTIFEQLCSQLVNMERCYFLYGDNAWEEGLLPVPSREQFKQLYLLIHRTKAFPLSANTYRSLEKRTGLSKRLIRFVFSVFADLQFIRQEGNQMVVCTQPERRPLTASTHYRQQVEREKVWQRLIYSSYRQLCHYLQQHVPGGLAYGFQEQDTDHSQLSHTGSSV
jgi:single-stranded-DNA-specific exonuclease